MTRMTEKEQPSTDMSRRDQTTLILLALAACLMVFLYFATRGDPRDPRTECQQLIGYDRQCLLDQAIKRLGIDPGYPQ